MITGVERVRKERIDLACPSKLYSWGHVSSWAKDRVGRSRRGRVRPGRVQVRIGQVSSGRISYYRL